jgi:fructose-bisphosphate aldolase class II
MKTLAEYISEAESKKVAIGHFNISTLEMLWGIVNAARNLNVPVIIGVSEGERNFIGVRQCVALIKSIREEYGIPIFLNADHSYSYERVQEAVDMGFDAAIIDGAKLASKENTDLTRRCVEYAREKKSNILIEGELGYIGQSSKVLDAIPEGVNLSRENLVHPDDAKRFVEETGVSLFAPAVGNIHGMLRTGHDPNLDIELIGLIRTACGRPLVLHGGSGTTDDDFVKSIDAGISVIHISTELRVAFRKALALALQENPEEVAPYKYLKNAVKEVEKVVEGRLKLFNKIS